MDTKKDLVPQYHDLLRPEIIKLIPHTAQHILDFGCGTGKLGEHIKQRQKCTYHGIEYNQQAVKIAKNRLNHILGYNIEDYPTTGFAGDYDCFIFADILEHLKDPQKAMKYYLKSLKETGTVIASIPNIAHPSIIAQLKHGLFRYANAGILDKTHLRFFTLTSIFQLFSGLNLKITKVIPSPSVDNPIQWLITAKKLPYHNKPTPATIIIPTFNHLELLQITIKSIRTADTIPCRIIVVNNGSNQQTQEWIEEQDDILEIRNEQNLGFPIAVNLGIEITNTPYIIIANNDIIVTKNWLSKMIACAESDPNIGIVGPMSNRVSGPQIDKTANYKTEKELAAHVSKVTNERPQHYKPFHRIVFLCTLIKKEVIEKVGYLDENFSPGNFEDDDYCVRSLQAGFVNIIDQSTFIHHYGSRSWLENPSTYQTILSKNRNYFLCKWGDKALKFLNPSST